MLSKLSKKTGLTKDELKIMFFVTSAFVFGLIYYAFFQNKDSEPYKKFDYASQDLKFFSDPYDSLQNINRKSDDKEVDYKQEVLDFNSESFNKVQKKILPAEKSINLNTVTVEDLINLPGIGEKTAQKIIDYRTQIKRFNSVDQLLNVKGIGTSKLAKIKKFIFID